VREGDELLAGSGLSREERRRDPSRVLALTDGVYAIIITLLVLDDRLGVVLARPGVVRFSAGDLRCRLRDRLGFDGASLAVCASAPALYFLTITLLRWLAPRGSAGRQLT
jgi:hypothetical protein